MHLAFVGDIALGDHPKTVGFGFRSRYTRGIPSQFAERLRPPGPKPSLMLGNLEFPLIETGGPAGIPEPQCRGLPGYAGFLASAGLTALNVANNHSSQHGAAAFVETVTLLRASGIHVVGTPSDFSPEGVVRVSACRVAILGWSDRPRQYSNEVPPYNEFSDLAYEQIAEARRRADLVVASIHWGDEFVLVPSDRERAIARAMVEAGASFVIGHHPHVLREVEEYRGAIIAYSLGNFVGDMTWDPKTRVTGWLTAQVEGGRIVSSALTPAVMADDYFPAPVTDEPGRRMWDRVAAARRSHAKRVARRGYQQIAEAARVRHAWRTAWMMLRNVRRYPPGVGKEVFQGAFVHRLQAMLTRRPKRSSAAP